MLCRVGLTSSGWLWGSEVTALLMTFNEISMKTFLVISTYVCPHISTFLWPVPDWNAPFLLWPTGICVLICIWLHCECCYFFLIQLIVFVAFSSSLLGKKSLRWCLTRMHITRTKLFLGSAIYLFIFCFVSDAEVSLARNKWIAKTTNHTHTIDIQHNQTIFSWERIKEWEIPLG